MLLHRLIILALLAFVPAMPVTAADSPLRDDGIHTEAWMKTITFLDLKDDLAEAKKQGKGLVILFEAPGCTSCKKLHEVNFRQPDLVNYIRKHFDVMQINVFGDNEVTDFDGQKMNERKLAHKLGIHFTPTTVFYGDAGKELFRMPGYFKPSYYRKGFQFVLEKGPQRDMMFPQWLREKSMQRKKTKSGT